MGFNAAFILAGGLLAVALLVIQLWATDTKTLLKDRKLPAFRLVDRSLVNPGILSVALATFLMANAFSMVTTLENELNARLGMNALGFGFAFSALMISRLVFQVPLGRLSDIIGRKPLVFTGLLLMAPATALLGVAGSETQLVLIRLFQGVAAAGIAAPAFAVAGDLSRAGGEGRQLSLVTMGFGLGIAVGPLLAGLLGTVFFELPFLIGGAMSLMGALVVLRHMPETIERRGSSYRRRPGGDQARGPPGRPQPASQPFRRPPHLYSIRARSYTRPCRLHGRQ